WTIVGASLSALSHMTRCVNAIIREVEISTVRAMCFISARREAATCESDLTTISSLQLRDGSDEWGVYRRQTTPSADISASAISLAQLCETNFVRVIEQQHPPSRKPVPNFPALQI